MSKQDKKRYQDYADSIPYAPNINKNLFLGGGGKSTLEEVLGDVEDTSGDIGGSTGGDSGGATSEAPSKLEGAADIISVVGQALGQGLSEIGQWRKQKWQEKQADELAQFKRVEAGNQAYKNFQNTLQQNRNNRIQQQQLLAQETINNRNQRQAQALATMNNGNAEPNKFMIGGLISAGLAIDKGLGSAIGGEYHSGAGDVMSKIPGLGIIGGLTNAFFGIKVDKAKLQAVDAAETNLTNSAMAAGTAGSFEQIQGPQAVNYASANAYSGGLFSKGKARRKNAELRERLRAAEDYANRGVANGVDNVTKSQNDMLASTYYAYGGALMPYAPEVNLKALGGFAPAFTGGAIDYAFTNDYLHNGYLKATKDNKLDSIINGDNYLSNGQSFFADGGEMPNATGYEEGNTYNVNENEYRKLLEQGYQVEVINK